MDQRSADKKISPEVASLYSTAVSFGATETILIWTRYAGFLLINGFFVNSLLSNSEQQKSSMLLVLIGVLVVLVNAVWHILNFAGWLNQNLWYNKAGNLDNSLNQWMLPTDDFKQKIRLPYGWIYWIAQIVPTGFSIGGAICFARGFIKGGLNICESGYISSAAWIIVAVVTLLIEYKAISTQGKCGSV